jgi:hypothetical protein
MDGGVLLAGKLNAQWWGMSNRQEATYHVRIKADALGRFYIGEHRRPVSDVQDALVMGRAEALYEAEETRKHHASLGFVGVKVEAVMLTATGKVRVVGGKR